MLDAEIFDLNFGSWGSVCGLDEVGLGAWCGPVVASAVILHKAMPEVNDSKKLSVNKREAVCMKLINDPDCFFGLGVASAGEVDSYGVAAANILAMHRALSQLQEKYERTCAFLCIADGCRNVDKINGKPVYWIVDGDANSMTIGAASIIAKVYRDSFITNELSTELINRYGLASNKGYGTRKHADSLNLYGVSYIHRFSYKPIKEIVMTKKEDNIKVILVSGLSGAGKTTLVSKVLAESTVGVVRGITCTTRSKRDNEVDGVSYHFLTEAAFRSEIENGNMIEWVRKFGNLYGVRASDLDRVLSMGKHVILTLDTAGVKHFVEDLQRRGIPFISVFITTDIDVLRQRLVLRGDVLDDIEHRMSEALIEMQEEKKFDIVIENIDLEDAKLQFELGCFSNKECLVVNEEEKNV